MTTNAPKDLVHPENDGFVERITPKVPDASVFFFKCKSKRYLGLIECGGTHFRHTGYMKTMLPFMRAGGEKRVNVEDYQVMVCVKCRSCYIWLNEQMYDVTEQIDLKAWEKLEKEAQKATGPGGQC